MRATIFDAPSASLSVPLACVGDVIIASPPAASTGAAIRSSSVATITRAIDFAFDACRHTRTIIGTPAISASAFAGRREEPYRAGTTAITETSARNFLRRTRVSIQGAHTLVTDGRDLCQFRAVRLPTFRGTSRVGRVTKHRRARLARGRKGRRDARLSSFAPELASAFLAPSRSL